MGDEEGCGVGCSVHLCSCRYIQIRCSRIYVTINHTWLHAPTQCVMATTHGCLSLNNDVGANSGATAFGVCIWTIRNRWYWITKVSFRGCTAYPILRGKYRCTWGCAPFRVYIGRGLYPNVEVGFIWSSLFRWFQNFLQSAKIIQTFLGHFWFLASYTLY